MLEEKTSLRNQTLKERRIYSATPSRINRHLTRYISHRVKALPALGNYYRLG
mgnify:CR=1 FL=1